MAFNYYNIKDGFQQILDSVTKNIGSYEQIEAYAKLSGRKLSADFKENYDGLTGVINYCQRHIDDGFGKELIIEDNYFNEKGSKFLHELYKLAVNVEPLYYDEKSGEFKENPLVMGAYNVCRSYGLDIFRDDTFLSDDRTRYGDELYRNKETYLAEFADNIKDGKAKDFEFEYKRIEAYCKAIGGPNTLENTLIDIMSGSSEFCEFMAEKCYKDLEKHNAWLRSNTPQPIQAKYIDKDIKFNIEMACIAQKFSEEIQNNKNCLNPKTPENLREMSVPHPAFRTKDAAYPEPAEDREKKTQSLDEYVAAIKKNIGYKITLNKNDAALLEDRGGPEYSKEFTDKAVPFLDKALKAMENNSFKYLGMDKTISISAENFKNLTGTGSPEYTRMHKAFADYLNNRRILGASSAKQIDNIYTSSRDYLLLKDTSPITPSGKHRIAAANEIFLQTGMSMLMDGNTSEEFRNVIEKEFMCQMLRSPDFRDKVIRQCIRMNESGMEGPCNNLLAFGVTAEEKFKASHKDGILHPGKIKNDDDKYRLDNDVKAVAEDANRYISNNGVNAFKEYAALYKQKMINASVKTEPVEIPQVKAGNNIFTL